MADTLGWARYPDNTTGPNSLVAGDDYNGARNAFNRWVPTVLDVPQQRIDLPSSGSYLVQYTGNQNLATIILDAIADDAAWIRLSVDPAISGGDLTILHNVGNIKTNRGIPIVLTSREWIVEVMVVGGVVRAWLPYGD